MSVILGKEKRDFIDKYLNRETLAKIVNPENGDWRTYYEYLWKLPACILGSCETGRFNEAYLHVAYQVESFYILLDLFEGSCRGCHQNETIDDAYIFKHSYITTSIDDALEYLNHLEAREGVLIPRHRKAKLEQLEMEVYPLFEGIDEDVKPISTALQKAIIFGDSWDDNVKMYAWFHKHCRYIVTLLPQQGSPRFLVDDEGRCAERRVRVLLSENPNENMPFYWLNKELPEEIRKAKYRTSPLKQA